MFILEDIALWAWGALYFVFKIAIKLAFFAGLVALAVSFPLQLIVFLLLILALSGRR